MMRRVKPPPELEESAMGLKEVLSKMKLVEFAETPAAVDSTSAKPSMGARSVDAVPELDQLLASVGPPRFDPAEVAHTPAAGGESPSSDADAGANQIPTFEDVYRAAGISNAAHGYTAFKVLEILSSPEFSTLEPKAKAAALSGFLKMNPTGPVPIADILEDAVRRDQALDRFEQFLGDKLGKRKAEIEEQNAALQAEIDELARKNREQMDENRRALEAEEARLADWRATKRAEEKRLFEAVAPFVDANPITT